MQLDGRNTILGSYGKVWWDGDAIMEIESFELTPKIERESVQFCGSLDEDTKMKGIKVEGKMKVRKVFSRNKKKFLDKYKQGEDLRSTIVACLADPDAIGHQKERISVRNVWFNSLPLMKWELGKKCEEEISFGCRFSDIDLLEDIKENY